METPQNTEAEQPPVAKSNVKRNLIIAGLIIAVAVFQFFSWRESHKSKGEEPAKSESLLKRDEPVKEQIFQGDYENKVREMLDSGKTVAEISKETGIRKDVIRKIKTQKTTSGK